MRHSRTLAAMRSTLLLPYESARTIPVDVRRRSICTACRLARSQQQTSAIPLRVRQSSRPSARIILPATFTAGQRRRASVASATIENCTKDSAHDPTKQHRLTSYPVNTEDIGPIQEYDRRVQLGLIRNDEHQRGEFLVSRDHMLSHASDLRADNGVIQVLYKACNTCMRNLDTTRRGLLCTRPSSP